MPSRKGQGSVVPVSERGARLVIVSGTEMRRQNVIVRSIKEVKNVSDKSPADAPKPLNLAEYGNASSKPLERPISNYLNFDALLPVLYTFLLIKGTRRGFNRQIVWPQERSYGRTNGRTLPRACPARFGVIRDTS